MAELQEKTVLFKARPNKINSLGTHIVDPIGVDHPGNVIPSGIMSRMGDEALIGGYTANLHKGESMTAGFDDNGPMKIFEVPGKWPQSSGVLSSNELRDSVFNYQGNKVAWDKKIIKDYNANAPIVVAGAESETVQQIFTFDEYKAYIINGLKESAAPRKMGSPTSNDLRFYINNRQAWEETVTREYNANARIITSGTESETIQQIFTLDEYRAYVINRIKNE